MENKTDRELLELAAKTAGLVDPVYIDTSTWNDPGGVIYSKERGHWNPLKDNAQAFELMAKLNMLVNFNESRIIIGGLAPVIIDIDGDSDYLSEVRRAIVIAAAKIGESKHGH